MVTNTEAEMAEEKTEMVNETVEVEDNGQVQEDANIEKMKAALEKANKEAAKFRHKLDEIEKAKERELIEKSESMDELRNILKEKEGSLAALEDRANKYAEMVDKFVASELEAIPEDKRDLVPDIEPEKKLDWIRQAKSKGLFTTQASAPSVRRPGENNTTDIVELIKKAKTRKEIDEIRRAHGI